MTTSPKARAPITPGEILEVEFLEPLGITPYFLAQATGLSHTRIGEVLRGKRRMTPDTALRLSKALGLSGRFWLTVQLDHDVEVAHDRHQVDLDRVEVLVVG